VFSGVGVKNIILEYQKSSNDTNIPLRLKHNGSFGSCQELDTDLQSVLNENIFNEIAITSQNTQYDNCVEWGGIFYLSVGMVLQSDEKRAKGLFVKDDLISSFEDNTHTKPYIEGKDIETYKIERIRYLEWGTSRSPALLRRPTFSELYIYPKIMMGSMTSGIYDDTGLVSNHSVLISTKWDNLALVDNKSINMSIGKYYSVKGDEIQSIKDDLILNSKDFNIKYCLSILNSSFAKRFFETIGRSSVGLYPDDVKKLPIKKIPLHEQEVFAQKVDGIIKLKKDLLNQDTAILEKELDDMVSKLYE
jgi:hypothetical protein